VRKKFWSQVLEGRGENQERKYKLIKIIRKDDAKKGVWAVTFVLVNQKEKGPKKKRRLVSCEKKERKGDWNFLRMVVRSILWTLRERKTNKRSCWGGGKGEKKFGGVGQSVKFIGKER